jgi:hypothetical protein
VAQRREDEQDREGRQQQAVGRAVAGDGWEVVDIQGLYDSISSDRSALAA